MTNDYEQTVRNFQQAVNMTASELERWLATAQSKSVGQKNGGTESIGYRSGKRIAKLLDKHRDEYSADDLEHMKRLHQYVKRHTAQRPDRDVTETRWRYSLMNWGHDPLK